MIEYDRIDFDECIDVNKTSNSRECWLCHYWYFLDKISTIKVLLRWLSRYVNENNKY